MKKSFSTNLPLLMLLAFLMLSPLLGISQAEPPVITEGVPLDDNMNLMFLLIGLAFAAFVTIKQLRKRAIIN